MARRSSLQPLQSVREKVGARDQYRCCRCGKRYHWAGFSVHHRHLRSHPYPRLHEASNLICLCGDGTAEGGCHEWVHAHPKLAKHYGWIVSGFNDHPETVPVLTRQHGWVLLDDQGGWTRCDPPADTSR
ncbi:hypothetical protein GFD21_06465 [Bifidobacterium sp. SMA15]|uniref:C2H2-type domain-containing protein n=1 Tax=Bifidobacterium platyrrhinorum TaxID=2661628 RepID=A0A6L9SUB0_9BIFI|nr:hypothetical protein [Bifidobacterium platyrrhinorum]